jgi:hypothetical protein
VTNGLLKFSVHEGWLVEPAQVTFNAVAGEEISIETTVTPQVDAQPGVLSAELHIDGQTYHRGFHRIEYDHIPVQTIFPPAQVRVVLLDVKTAGKKIGYIPGAGDSIPESLQRIGYAVDTLGEADMTSASLATYDAVVLGIRALNTIDRIGFYMPALFAYAEQGGVVILQYNTHRGLKTETFSPYPFTITQDRVTDETAEMRVLAPDHPVLHYPNPYIVPLILTTGSRSAASILPRNGTRHLRPSFRPTIRMKNHRRGACSSPAMAKAGSCTPACRGSVNSLPEFRAPIASLPISSLWGMWKNE